MEQNWQKKGLIYNVKADHNWNKTHAQVPVVDEIGNGQLRIYYASRDSQNRSRTSYIETEVNNPRNIIFVKDQPILELGNTGAFDDSGIMPACLFSINQEVKYLYYIGWTSRKTVPYSNAIGLAISKDAGKTFKKFSQGPIIGIGPNEPYFTGTCNVIQINNEFIAYYLSCTGWIEMDGHLEPTYNIKIARSSDGINWKLANEVAIPLRDGEGGIASASVVKVNSSYYMWFSARGLKNYRTDTHHSYRIGFATSKDGFEWKRSEKSVLPLSVEGWDSTMLAYPYVISYQNKLLMFYNGNGFGITGFGYAECQITKN